MNELLYIIIMVILGMSIILMPEFKINNNVKIVLNLIILMCIMFISLIFTIKTVETQCLKGKFTYKQVIKYEPKTIKDSIGNDKIIYLPVDTIYLKK